MHRGADPSELTPISQTTGVVSLNRRPRGSGELQSAIVAYKPSELFSTLALGGFATSLNLHYSGLTATSPHALKLAETGTRSRDQCATPSCVFNLTTPDE